MDIIVQGRGVENVAPNEVILNINFFVKGSTYEEVLKGGVASVQRFVDDILIPNSLEKENMKTKEILGILMLFLCTFCFINCDDDNEQTNELTPEALYQTSWRGTGHCEAWTVQNMGVGMQFVDTQKGKVNWEGYDEIDITYTIEGKYITFNSNALYLGGAPWIIKSYTQKHITIIQNEISPDKEKVATIELEKID